MPGTMIFQLSFHPLPTNFLIFYVRIASFNHKPLLASVCVCFLWIFYKCCLSMSTSLKELFVMDGVPMTSHAILVTICLYQGKWISVLFCLSDMFVKRCYFLSFSFDCFDEFDLYLKMHFHEGVYYKNAGTFLHEVSKHHDKPYSVVYAKTSHRSFSCLLVLDVFHCFRCFFF